ncbi:hypothetical protein D3C71_1806370 [compost metagenome]
MAHGGQGPRTRLGFQAGGHQGLVDGRRQLPNQFALGRTALYVVDHKLQHSSFWHRQGQLDPVARRMPAGPVAQRAAVAAGGVLGGRFGQQFAHRIGGLLGQLFRQHQAGSRRGEHGNRRIIFHTM